MNGVPTETAASTIDPSAKRPTVVTNFSGYVPPFDVVPIVEKLLASVPQKYLIGLKEVVLTDSSGLSRKRRRSVTKARKRKIKIVEAGGLYHAACHGNLAWIEIFVDNKLRGIEKSWWLERNQSCYIPVLRGVVGLYWRFPRRLGDGTTLLG
jgi:hypothetical protein